MLDVGHCDEYINDEEAPEALRIFLEFNRRPAIQQIGMEIPELYAIHKESGECVRVTMASRFGDVGITRNLDQHTGYHKRVLLDELTGFSETPSCWT